MEVKSTQTKIENTNLGDLAVYNMIKTKMDGEPEVSLPIHFVQTYDNIYYYYYHQIPLLTLLFLP